MEVFFGITDPKNLINRKRSPLLEGPYPIYYHIGGNFKTFVFKYFTLSRNDPSFLWLHHHLLLGKKSYCIVGFGIAIHSTWKLDFL